MRFAWIEERPFNFISDGALTGCDVGLAQRLFAALGEPFEPIETTFSELLPGLADGRWEVTTGMFITPDRQASAHFTRPIWSLCDGLLVARDGPPITGYASLARQRLRLAVLTGQVQRLHALRLGVSPADLVEFDSYSEAAAAVLDGRVSAYASVALAHEQQPDPRLVCVPIGADEVPPAVGGFACASDEIRAALDRGLGS